MKRILIAMLLICTLLCSLLVSVGATEGEPTDPPVIPECEHNYELSMPDFVNPSCTEPGTKVEICSECGDRKESPVTKLGHDFTIELENVSPDCENDGHITMKCSRCDETDTEVLESPGHSNTVTAEEEASCTKKGSITYKCDTCGAEDTIETKMLEHTYTIVVSNTATCTAAGVKTLKCETCTDTIERDVSALGHDYPTTPDSDTATCKEAGTKTFICKNGCGVDKVVDSPKKTTHTYGEWEITQEATCGKNGSKKATCTLCGNVKTETITGGTHTFGTVKYITKLPTSSTTGSYTQYCLNCNAKGTTGTIPKFTNAASKDLSDYTLPPLVATPTAGDVTEGTKVKLTFIAGTATNISSKATIYYTTNGRAPTTSNSEEYTSSGIEIEEDVTIKAFAVFDDDQYDIKKSATYTFDYDVEECEHKSLNSYKYVTKLPTSKKAGTYVRYCNNCGEEVEYDIAKGTTNLNSYYTARPELSEDIDDVTLGETVHLTCALDDVIIYYTTDGKNPSVATSKEYDDDDGIEIDDEDFEIKAIAKYIGDDFTSTKAPKNSTVVTFEFEVEECDHEYGDDMYITKFPTSSKAGTYVQYCEECGAEDEGTISKSKYNDELDEYMIARPTPEDDDTEVRSGTKVKFEVGDIDLDDVTIYYALDGKSPTNSSYRKTYDPDEGIEIEEDTTIKLYAVYTGDDFEPENSDVVTYKFTVGDSEHDFGQMYITKVPTTSIAGSYIAYCEDDDCNETDTGTIPKGETDLEDYMLHPLTPSVKEGKVAYGTKLTFTKKLNAVKIYYTTDGKSPVTSSTRKEYTTAGIELTNAVTVVKVYSVYTGNSTYGIQDSEIQTFTYQVETKKVQLKPTASKGGYMSLAADKKFRPDAKATRYEVIDAMNALFNTNVTPSTTVYKDVDAAHKDVVARFIAAGLLNGYDDGTFKGTNNIKRSELCKVLAIALGLDTATASSSTKKFPDVASTHWAYRYISVLTEKGYLAGDTAGNFRPEDNITRAELVVVLNRIAKVNLGKGVTIADVPSTHWAYGYICGALLTQ